jgi:hypothetical protein
MWLVWSLAAIGLGYAGAAWVRTAAHASLSPAHRSLFVKPGPWAELYLVHVGDPALFASLYGLGWWVWVVYLSGTLAGVAVAAVMCLLLCGSGRVGGRPTTGRFFMIRSSDTEREGVAVRPAVASVASGCFYPPNAAVSSKR